MMCIKSDRIRTYNLQASFGISERNPLRSFAMPVLLRHHIVLMHLFYLLFVNADSRMLLHIRVIFLRTEAVPGYFGKLSEDRKLNTDSRDEFRCKAAVSEALHGKLKLHSTVSINLITVFSFEAESHA